MKEQLIGKNLNNKGFATLEILIAFVIVILCMGSVVIVVFGNQSIAIDLETNNEAISRAEKNLENARALSRLDFNSVNSSIGTEISGPLTYDKKIEVTPGLDDPNTIDFDESLFTKKVLSTISWQTTGRNLSVILSTLLTNPDAVSGGDTCSSELTGNWTNPQKTSYALGADILNDTSSGFPVTSIQSFNHKLYVTVNNTNGNNPGTFFILDISDPTSVPDVIANFDNNPAVGKGLNAVAIDGKNYAYVTNANGSNFNTCVQSASCSQLQTIDISNPYSPSVAATYKIPGVTGNSGQAIGTSIYYKSGIVYLGLAKATGPEFNIIDVGGGGTPLASPTNPIKIGSYEIDNGVNSILVKNNYAYIASPNDQELITLDVSDPKNPFLVGGFNAPAGGGNNGNGKSLYLVGNTLYLGRTLLNGNEFYILNNINPETNLPILGSSNIQDGDDGQPPAPSNTSINGLLIRNYLAFLITNEEFQIWKINNTTNIERYATPIILPPGSGNLQGTASDCEGNYIYVGSLGSNDKGYISVITAGP